MTLAEIEDKKLTCVVHTKTKNEALLLVKILGVDENRLYDETDFINIWDAFKENTCYRVVDGKVDMSDCVKYYQSIHEKIYRFSDLFATGGVVSIHDLPTSEWYNPMRLTFKNGSSIEALPNTSDIIQNTSDFCTGFRGGNTPKPVKIEVIKDRTKTVKDWIDSLSDAWAKLGCTSFIMSPDEIKKMEEKKMPTKFTFYVTDWVDINKTNGEKIPMKRTVAYIGSNTDVEADTSCPVAEYDERTGCLIAAAKISAKRSTEAKMMYNIARSTWGTELSWAILFELANAAFNGNFERAYKKFHNDNIRFEKKRLTCNFCGKVFETIEEKTKHENEHIQNKKNKREKYLIRKEAKRRLAEAEREGKIEQTMKELCKK